MMYGIELTNKKYNKEIYYALGDKFAARRKNTVFVCGYYGESVDILNSLGYTTDEDELTDEEITEREQ